MTNEEKTDIIIEAAELAGYKYNRVEGRKNDYGQEISNEFRLQPEPNEILVCTDSGNWQGSIRNELFWNLKHSYNEFSQDSRPVLNNQMDEETYNKIESLLMSIPITEEEIVDLKESVVDDGYPYNYAAIIYNEEKSQDDKICFTYITGVEGKEQDFFFNNWEEVNKEFAVGIHVDEKLRIIAYDEAFRAMIEEGMGEFGKDIVDAIIQMNEEKFGNKITEQDIDFDGYDRYGDGFIDVCTTETYVDGNEHSVRVEAEVNEEDNKYKLNVYMYGDYKTDNEYFVGEVEFDNAEELIIAIQNLDVDSIVNEDLLLEAVMDEIELEWHDIEEIINDDFELEDDFGDDDDNPEGISIIGKLQDKADKVKEQPHTNNDIDIDDLDIS